VGGYRVEAAAIVSYSTHPAVVRVWHQDGSGRSSGSGFHVGAGAIVTCAHVIRGGDAIHVDVLGRKAPLRAKVVEVDGQKDVAILLVDDETIPHIRVLEQPLRAVAAHVVTILGYPGGGAQRRLETHLRYPTSVIHSATDRRPGIELAQGLDAGASGGPLLTRYDLGEPVLMGMQNTTHGAVDTCCILDVLRRARVIPGGQPPRRPEPPPNPSPPPRPLDVLPDPRVQQQIEDIMKRLDGIEVMVANRDGPLTAEQLRAVVTDVVTGLSFEAQLLDGAGNVVKTQQFGHNDPLRLKLVTADHEELVRLIRDQIVREGK
jgi:hypothetical protein